MKAEGRIEHTPSTGTPIGGSSIKKKKKAVSEEAAGEMTYSTGHQEPWSHLTHGYPLSRLLYSLFVRI